MPALGVWLNRARIGTFTNLAGDYNLFSFDDEYIENTARPILSQAFLGIAGNLISVIPRSHRVAPPFFANLLPEEGTLFRNIVARQYEINNTRDYPYLRSLGLDLPGAIIMREIESESWEPAEVIEEIIPIARPFRFSLAGVQPKFSASMIGNRLTMPVSGLGGNWIAKLPTNAFSRLPENEFYVMALAKLIGLPVPETRLENLDRADGVPENLLPTLHPGEPRKLYAISRFDRQQNGPRIQVEDFNQIADQKPADKYDHKASHWIANVIATLCPPEDLDDFIRRLVFGVCIGNNDMHLKNWALYYPDEKTPRLSPMYDFVCTRYYYPHGELALTIGGERTFEDVGLDALRRFARSAEISANRVAIIARETVQAVQAAWPVIKENVDDESMVEAVERHFSTVPLMRLREN